ncbi:MAG: flagellar biosynthesis protein [Lachnospiraceae bacterium]|nr:flagellar biosynthesis protein [Lachnospiraceae bacterium]
MIAEARQQAETILAEARQQAETIRKQAEEAGYENGYGTGLQSGNEKAEAELQIKRGQLEEEQRQLEEEYRQKIDELEPYLVDIVAEVFEKVFHVQFDDTREILIYLIQQTILGAEGTKDFQVRVSLKDYEFVENHKSEITEQVGDAVHVEIMADTSLKERQCMIETDSGIFDCGTDLQLDNLIKALRSLSL